MATALDDRSLIKLLDVMCDVRVQKREIVKLLSTLTYVEQKAVFDFVMEYIKWYSFQNDTGSFINENMDIAITCKQLKTVLD